MPREILTQSLGVERFDASKNAAKNRGTSDAAGKARPRPVPGFNQ